MPFLVSQPLVVGGVCRPQGAGQPTDVTGFPAPLDAFLLQAMVDAAAWKKGQKRGFTLEVQNVYRDAVTQLEPGPHPGGEKYRRPRGRTR